MTNHRTRYATYADAMADGWRRINRNTDIDISGVGPQGECMFGYAFRAPDGQESTTISLSDERNKMGWKGCWAEMFRTETFDDAYYGFVDRVADSLVEFLSIDGPTARSYAERLAKSLGLDVERRPDSYRFISRWFDPSVGD